MSSEHDFADDKSQDSQMDDDSDEDPTLFGPSTDKIEMYYTRIRDDDSNVPKPRLII